MDSFIIRLVPPEADRDLRGVVRRVADGSEMTFADGDALLTLLRSDPGDDWTESGDGEARP